MKLDCKDALDGLSLKAFLSDWHRGLPTSLDPDPAELGVAGGGVLPVFASDARQAIGADGIAPGFDVDMEQPGGIQPEDLVLDDVGQLRILELFQQLIGHLQTAQAFDLPLRAAAPDRIGAPEDVIGAGYLDHLPEHVQAADRVAHRQLVKEAAQLEVDVANFAIAAEDAVDVADPGNFLRVLGDRILDALAGAPCQKVRAPVTGVV